MAKKRSLITFLSPRDITFLTYSSSGSYIQRSVMRDMKTFFIIVLTWQVSIAQDPCHPCHCINRVLACSSSDLTAVPMATFMGLPNAKSYQVLDLSNNNISDLPQDAFANLAVQTILLNNVGLANMHLNAFLSISANLTELQIADNKINTIPTALEKLKVLQKLDIRNNPIVESEFDNTIFQSLGDTLKEFHFGSPTINQWPLTLTHFPKLEVLDLDGSNIQWFPFTAFHGYEYTLKNLTVRNTKLFQIPQAISTLVNLHTLHFDNNINVGDTGILASAFTNPGDVSGTSSITHLSLKNNSLTTMPSVLRKLTRLQTLEMDNNQMWYISDNSVVNIKSTYLSTLSLRNCNLDRIPHSLLRLNSLRSLDLSGNGIHSIELNDIGQHSLSKLDLSHNPVEYISENAFKNMPNLTEISFAGSKIKHMPHALNNIMSSLRILNLDKCDVECTCDLTWFAGKIDMNRTKIVGECETIERSISDYMIKRIPKCPS